MFHLSKCKHEYHEVSRRQTNFKVRVIVYCLLCDKTTKMSLEKWNEVRKIQDIRRRYKKEE